MVLLFAAYSNRRRREAPCVGPEHHGIRAEAVASRLGADSSLGPAERGRREGSTPGSAARY